MLNEWCIKVINPKSADDSDEKINLSTYAKSCSSQSTSAGSKFPENENRTGTSL